MKAGFYSKQCLGSFSVNLISLECVWSDAAVAHSTSRNTFYSQFKIGQPNSKCTRVSYAYVHRFKFACSKDRVDCQRQNCNRQSTADEQLVAHRRRRNSISMKWFSVALLFPRIRCFASEFIGSEVGQTSLIRWNLSRTCFALRPADEWNSIILWFIRCKIELPFASLNQSIDHFSIYLSNVICDFADIDEKS